MIAPAINQLVEVVVIDVNHWIRNWWQWVPSRPGLRLRHAGSLDRLVIDLQGPYKSDKAMVTRNLMPLIEVLHAAGQGTDQRSVMDILELKDDQSDDRHRDEVKLELQHALESSIRESSCQS